MPRPKNNADSSIASSSDPGCSVPPSLWTEAMPLSCWPESSPRRSVDLSGARADHRLCCSSKVAFAHTKTCSSLLAVGSIRDGLDIPVSPPSRYSGGNPRCLLHRKPMRLSLCCEREFRPGARRVSDAPGPLATDHISPCSTGRRCSRDSPGSGSRSLCYRAQNALYM